MAGGTRAHQDTLSLMFRWAYDDSALRGHRGGEAVKIDIHTHTRKCKSGDAATREIAPEEFCSAILSTEVRVVAITNHNVFDLAQFQEIRTRIGKDAQVWPGVELDVYDDKTRGHLLVITRT